MFLGDLNDLIRFLPALFGVFLELAQGRGIDQRRLLFRLLQERGRIRQFDARLTQRGQVLLDALAPIQFGLNFRVHPARNERQHDERRDDDDREDHDQKVRLDPLNDRMAHEGASLSSAESARWALRSSALSSDGSSSSTRKVMLVW